MYLPFALLSMSCTLKGSDVGVTITNDPPTASITSHSDGDEVLEGYVVTFYGTVTDGDDDFADLETKWMLGGREICPLAPPEEDGLTSCEALVEPGDGRLVLEVQDGMDSGDDAVDLTIVETLSPTAMIISPVASEQYYADHLVTFEGSVADNEDSAADLIVWWESSLVKEPLEVEASPDSDGTVLGTSLLPEGEQLITLHVEDTSGKTTSEGVTITVGPDNSAPECSITAPEDGSAGLEGSAVLFEGLATDVDVSPESLEIYWHSDKDGELHKEALHPDSDGQVSFSTASLSVDTHTVTMTVYDEVGESCAVQLLYTVGTVPLVTIESPSDGEVISEDSSVTFLGTVSDGEDTPDDLTLVWESSLSGVLHTESADSAGSTTFSTDVLELGEHEITLTATDSDGFYTSASVLFTYNGLPSAPVVSISPDPAYTSDTLRANIDAESVDPEGDTVSYTYSWYRDGKIHSSGSSTTVSSSDTLKGEEWSVTVLPSDAYGSGGISEAVLEIQNTPPVLAAVSISPDPAVEGDTLTCSPGLTTDDDSDSVTYSYLWTVEGADLAVTGPSLSSDWFDAGEEVVCTVTPNDGSDDGDSVSSSPLIIDNTPPVLEGVTLGPDPAYEDSTLTCSPGSSSDEDGDDVSFSYDWTVDGALLGINSETLDGSSFDRDQVVQCTVTPNDGSEDGDPVDSNELTIQNTPPELLGLAISPDPAYTSDALSCVVTSEDDRDGDAISYSYSWTVSGVDAGVTASVLDASAFVKGDSVACEATPDDGTDLGDSLSSDALTIQNSPPVLSSVTLSPDPAGAEDTLTCTPGSSSDADGDGVEFSIRWWVDGAEISASSESIDGLFEKGQTVQCSVTPDDGTDAGAEVSSNLVTIENTAPVLSSATLTPLEAYEDSVMSCTPGSASDADDDSISYSYAWTVDGAALSETGATLDGSWFDRDQAVVCIITPDDGTDAGAAVSSNEVIIQNTPPVVAGVQLTPEPAYTTDALVCTVTGSSDTDTDSIYFSYRWEVSGIEQAVSSSTSTLASSYFVKGDSVTCFVTPDDGSDEGSEISSNSVVIENSEPSGTSVSISPSSPFTTDDLTVVPSGWSDEDEDPEDWVVEWFVNGVSAGSGTTLDSSSFVRDDSIYVTVIPWDGEDYGSMLTSSAVIILNSVPTLPGVAITPTDPEPEDNLSCAVTEVSTDADGESITYSYVWYQNGILTSYVSSSIDASVTLHGDTWVCEITASDGSATSPAGSDSVLIADVTPPDAPEVNPVDNFRNDESMTISGFCEASSTLTLYFSDDSGSWTDTVSCDSSGSFSYSATPTRGYVTTVYVTNTDAHGNESDSSGLISTEVCDPEDVYDSSAYGTGYGDDESDPIDELDTLVDNDALTDTLIGNIVTAGDSDWYIIYTEDDASGDSDWLEDYNLQITLTEGDAEYGFNVWYLNSSSVLEEWDCDYSSSWDSFSYAPSERPCDPTNSNTQGYNYCGQYTSTWVVEVFRDTEVDSCQHYELEVSNGVW